MAVVNIVDVSSSDPSEERLWGCNIELPVPESQTEACTINVAGWVLGRSSPAVAVEVVNNGSVLLRAPIDILRSDIVAAFPDIPDAEQSGFHFTLDLLEIEPEFELLVRAVFRDESRTLIGTIRGRRSSLRSEIGEVTTASTSLSALLWGAHIDLPAPDSEAEIYAITVEGWVVGRSSQAIAVELVNEEAVFRRVPIEVQRPDIVAHYPAVLQTQNAGFQTTINTLGLTPEFDLFVRVVLRDGSRIPIGLVRGRRRSPRSSFQPSLQPLMITTYGRTGSNWLLRLLRQHPRILAYRPFEFEPRVGGYWMQILETLSEPASYLQTLNTRLSDEHWWLGRGLSTSELLIPDPSIQQWLGRDSIDAFVTYCQNRIEEFYQQVALLQDQPEASYFAEKHSSARFARTMIRDLYTQPREIVLVRDFRDMICSILAYNAKQEFVSFGRERVSSDEEFIWHVRLHALDLLRSYKSLSSQVHLLRYEDLILRPAATLNDLLEYLGLESKPSMIESMIQGASEETLATQEHRTSPDPRKSIGRWRHDLDASLQSVCQEAFSDLLEGFGYTE